MDRTRINSSEIIDRVQTEVRRWIRGFSDMDLMAFARGEWLPQVDLIVQDDRIVIFADLPGLAPGDVDLSLRGEILILSGEKPGLETLEKPLLGERRSGTFRRTLTLPYSVDPDGIEASLVHGLLEVKLPRRSSGNSDEIRIKVG